MDIYCPTCGEPWEFETLHEEAQERYDVDRYLPDAQGYEYGQPYYTKTYNPEWKSEDYQKVYSVVSVEFRANGCKALTNITDASWCKPKKNDETDNVYGLTRAEASSALYDILGDDMDGAAAMMDDLRF